MFELQCNPRAVVTVKADVYNKFVETKCRQRDGLFFIDVNGEQRIINCSRIGDAVVVSTRQSV